VTRRRVLFSVGAELAGHVAVGSLLRFPRPAPPLPPPAFGCGSSLPVGNYNVAMLMAFSSFFMHTYMYMHPHIHTHSGLTDSQQQQLTRTFGGVGQWDGQGVGKWVGTVASHFRLPSRGRSFFHNTLSAL